MNAMLASEGSAFMQYLEQLRTIAWATPSGGWFRSAMSFAARLAEHRHTPTPALALGQGDEFLRMPAPVHLPGEREKPPADQPQMLEPGKR
jgi:hypothetical protein